MINSHCVFEFQLFLFFPYSSLLYKYMIFSLDLYLLNLLLNYVIFGLLKVYYLRSSRLTCRMTGTGSNNFTNPDIPLSYPESSRLGTVEFKVPNQTPTFQPANLDTITNPKTVNFSSHLEDTLQKPQNNSNHQPKPVIKVSFQEHLNNATCCPFPGP